MKKFKFIAAAVVAMSFVGTASADPISWNAPWGSSEGNVINEFVFAYNSQSLVNDTNSNGVLDAGDTIHSAGGFGANGFNALPPLAGAGFETIQHNQVTGFAPNPFPGLTGYTSDYIFTFSFNNLMGAYDGTDFIYNSGSIQFGVYASATANGLTAGFNSLFDMSLTGGGPDNTLGQQKQIFKGAVTTTANNAGSIFSVGSQSLGDWLATSGVNMATNQTVTGGIGGFNADTVTFVNGVGVLAANHTGRMSLTSVPEPASIAILGLGLLGLAGARRRKS